MVIAAADLFSIEGLPARGSIIVVRTAEERARVRRVVLDRYGSEIAGRTTVICIRDRGDTGKLVGAKKQIFLDPGFASAVTPETLAKVRDLMTAANSRFRNPR